MLAYFRSKPIPLHTPTDVDQLQDLLAEHPEMRGLAVKGRVVVWDAMLAIHKHLQIALDIEPDNRLDLAGRWAILRPAIERGGELLRTWLRQMGYRECCRVADVSVWRREVP